MNNGFRAWWNKFWSVPPAKRDDLTVVVVTGFDEKLNKLLPYVYKHVREVKDDNIIHLSYHQFEQQTHNLPDDIEKVGYSSFVPEFSLSPFQFVVDNKLRTIKTPHVIILTSGVGGGTYERARHAEAMLKVRDKNVSRIDLTQTPYKEK